MRNIAILADIRKYGAFTSPNNFAWTSFSTLFL
jgi:hypothetical protein